jgi:hypothetical protein
MNKLFLLITVLSITVFMLIEPISENAQDIKRGTFNASQSNSLQQRFDLNGKLLQKKGDFNVFWIDNGVRRHVETLDYIFLADKVEEYMDVYLLKEGLPITKNTLLIRCIDKGDKNEGAIYLLDNGLKRHITSMEIFNKYNFNMKKVIDVPCAVTNAIKDSDAPLN